VTSCDKVRRGERIYGKYWADRNGFKLRKSLLARMEWLGMEEVGLELTGMDWNKIICFFPFWNGLEWRKSVLA
jgi:hypothetical protein